MTVSKTTNLYRVNRINGNYEFQRNDGSWWEKAPSQLNDEEFDYVECSGQQYHDDSYAYGLDDHCGADDCPYCNDVFGDQSI